MKKVTFLLAMLLVSTLCWQGNAQTYCTPPTVPYVEPISSVVYAGISNTSSATTGGAGYEDFTAISANVDAGGTQSIELKGNSNGPYTNYYTVFIDWNQNGTLNDGGEMYKVGSITGSTGTDGQKVTGSIAAPGDALAGNTRMRIIKNYNSYIINPCGAPTFGQIEDYTVNVTLSSCSAPSDMAAAEITTNTADISWSENGSATEWEVIYGFADFDPLTEGTTVTDDDGTLGISLTGLTSGSYYEFYVKAICGPGDESSLSGPTSFATDFDPSNSFITTWKTDNYGSSNNTSITIPTFSGETYNYDVDWGDGNGWETGFTGNASHDYGAGNAGTYTVKIRGVFPRIYFSLNGATDKGKILSIEQWGTNVWTSMGYAFSRCTNLVGNATDIPDLSAVSNMKYMFTDNFAFNGDISNWNVENVTNMESMFYSASSFNQDIGNWNVENVTNMKNMFAYAGSFNQNLGNWNVENVANMTGMCISSGLSTANYDALLIGWASQSLKNNVTFDAWDLKYCSGKVARDYIINTYSWDFFDSGLLCTPSDYFITTWKTNNPGPSNNTSITIPTTGGGYNYDVSWKNDGVWQNGFTGDASHNYGTAGTYTVAIRGSFPRIYFNISGDKKKLLSIEQWGNGIWSSMEKAFSGCNNLVGNATDAPNLSLVTNMFNMFAGASDFNGNIDNWNVSNVTDMRSLFSGASAFNKNIGNWNVSNVTDMSGLFSAASAFNQDIGNWNVSNVTDMSGLFSGASAFNQDIGNWNVSSVTDMQGMFYRATAFNQNIGNWNVSSVTDMTYMFYDATLSTANYDALLNGWSTQTLQNEVSFNGGNSKYCGAGAARTNIISTYNWTITDGGQLCAPSDYFITTWKTDNPGGSNSTSITIPTEDGGYNYDVSWKNDGVWETGFTGNATHDYGTAGTYTVAIRGDFPRIYFNYRTNRRQILSIEQWGTNVWSSMNNAFTGCEYLVGNATDTPNLSDVSDMAYMFYQASNFNQNIGNWNVSNVTNMAYMFYQAFDFDKNIGNWNVANVTDMSHMFTYAYAFDQDIGGWNVGNVTNMEHMFNSAFDFNQDIGNWNVGNVTNMEYMFYGVSDFNQDIGNWNLGNVTNMKYMFNSASDFNQDIGNWNVGNVTNMEHMFYSASDFNQDIGNWNVGNVTNMKYMFNSASDFNQDIGNWNVGNVTNMEDMFYSASDFNQDIGNWNVGNVTNMEDMFYGVTLSTANYDALLNGWSEQTLQNGLDFSGGNSKYCNGQRSRDNIINTFGWTITDGGLAANCQYGDYFITTWKTDNYGYSNDTSITIPTTGGGYNYDVSWKNNGVWETGFTSNASHDYGTAGTYTVAIRGTFPRIYFESAGDNLKIMSVEQWGTNVWSSMNNAFVSCFNLLGNATDVPDLTSVTDMSYMFSSASAFNGDIGNWDVSNVTNMSYMFEYASAFNQNIGSWNVSNVTDMSSMFDSASAFNQNIGSWNVSNVANMYAMFQAASTFNQDISSWNVENVTNMKWMFNRASVFNQNISTWNVGEVTNMNAMFYQAFAFNQNIGSWNVENVTNMQYMFDGVTLSTANYDALLNGWSTQTLQNGVSFNGGNSQYCGAGAARATIISIYYWNITDGGQDASCVPPANDDCAGAIALTCGTPVSGTTYNATDSGLGPPSCAFGTQKDVFYTLDLVAGGEYTIAVNGGDYDGVLALYTGACGSLTELYCADNGFGTGREESITFTAATTKTIVIRTYDWSSSMGDFTIGVTCNTCPTITTYTIADGWDNGVPTSSKKAVFADDYNTILDSIDACSIEINSGVTVTVIENTTIKAVNDITINGDLIFLSSANGDGQLGIMGATSNITGNATVQRYMMNKRSYRMVSPAVTTTTSSIHDNWQEGATLGNPNPAPGFGTHITGSQTGQNGFDATATGNPSMFTVDLANQQFELIGNTDVNTLTAGNPYLLFVRGDRNIDLTNNNAAPTATTLRATGKLVTGNQPQTFTAPAMPVDETAFVMFGNPYQSAVDVSAIFATSTNVNTDHYYVYDPSLGEHGSYVTVTLGDGSSVPPSDANQYLQPGQGAQLAALGAGTVIVNFKEAYKTPEQHTSTNATGNSPVADGRLIGELYTQENYNNGGSAHDGFALLFSEGSSNNLTLEDAVKPMNFYENLGIDHEGTFLSIERREMPQASEVYLLYSNGYAHSDYTIKLTVDGLENTFLYLNDNFTGTSTLLEAGENSYNFSVDASNPLSKATDRFSIRTEERLGVDSNNLLAGIRLYPNPLNSDTFYINAPRLNGEELMVSINDLSGRMIFEQNLVCNASTVTVPMSSDIASGVYMVTLKHGDEVHTYRLIRE